jgi:hypothetical protein
MTYAVPAVLALEAVSAVPAVPVRFLPLLFFFVRSISYIYINIYVYI